MTVQLPSFHCLVQDVSLLRLSLTALLGLPVWVRVFKIFVINDWSEIWVFSLETSPVLLLMASLTSANQHKNHWPLAYLINYEQHERGYHTDHLFFFFSLYWTLHQPHFHPLKSHWYACFVNDISLSSISLHMKCTDQWMPEVLEIIRSRQLHIKRPITMYVRWQTLFSNPVQ